MPMPAPIYGPPARFNWEETGLARNNRRWLLIGVLAVALVLIVALLWRMR